VVSPAFRVGTATASLSSALGEVAQLVEHATENRGVGGSIPPLAIRLIERRYTPGGWRKPLSSAFDAQLANAQWRIQAGTDPGVTRGCDTSTPSSPSSMNASSSKLTTSGWVQPMLCGPSSTGITLTSSISSGSRAAVAS
jgi:hypothetical protein